MSAKYLGTRFDIHVGGKDHVPVHHTNEIAQHEGRYGHVPANYWLHGAFLKLDDNDKMSKSSGDFLRLQTLIERGYDPLVYRYLVLTTHYRSQLVFSWEALDAAQTALNRLRQAYFKLGATSDVDASYRDRMMHELNLDLNTPKALALAWELLKSPQPDAAKKGTLSWLDLAFGFGLDTWMPETLQVPETVQSLLEQRNRARAEKRWSDADALRTSIEAAGFRINDTPHGAVLERS
jgi:cysteinyl-tRNA synthetase